MKADIQKMERGAKVIRVDVDWPEMRLSEIVKLLRVISVAKVPDVVSGMSKKDLQGFASVVFRTEDKDRFPRLEHILMFAAILQNKLGHDLREVDFAGLRLISEMALLPAPMREWAVFNLKEGTVRVDRNIVLNTVKLDDREIQFRLAADHSKRLEEWFRNHEHLKKPDRFLGMKSGARKTKKGARK